MIEAAELKPCPFCGEEARLLKDCDNFLKWRVQVQCMGCVVETRLFPTQKAATDFWNTHAERPAKKGLSEE